MLCQERPDHSLPKVSDFKNVSGLPLIRKQLENLENSQSIRPTELEKEIHALEDGIKSLVNIPRKPLCAEEAQFDEEGYVIWETETPDDRVIKFSPQKSA